MASDLTDPKAVAEALAEFADIDEAEGGNPYVIATERAASALISSLVAEREQQPQFDGLPKRKLDGLLASGWQISGYAIHKDGEHGLVTTGGFVGWFTTAQNNALTAERLLAEARAEQPDMETFVRWLRAWTKARHGVWITHNTAKGAYNAYVATLSTGGVNG